MILPPLDAAAQRKSVTAVDFPSTFATLER